MDGSPTGQPTRHYPWKKGQLTVPGGKLSNFVRQGNYAGEVRKISTPNRDLSPWPNQRGQEERSLYRRPISQTSQARWLTLYRQMSHGEFHNHPYSGYLLVHNTDLYHMIDMILCLPFSRPAAVIVMPRHRKTKSVKTVSAIGCC